MEFSEQDGACGKALDLERGLHELGSLQNLKVSLGPVGAVQLMKAGK